MTQDPDGATRAVMVQLHPYRPEALDAATTFVAGMTERGITSVFQTDDVRVPELRARLPEARIEFTSTGQRPELVVVFGGDGSILRASEFALNNQVPLLGVNLGHVGFLAEMEPSQIDRVVEQVADRDYEVEQRVALRVDLTDADGRRQWSSFAINEVSIEKLSRGRMIQLLVSIDHRPLSLWSCDGLLVSTPTGSTAYAFSAGGPVIWPDVDAFLVVPLSAHALFARPLVVSPDSTVDMVLSSESPAVIICDGRRTVDVMPGHQIRVVRGERNLKIARLTEQPFTTRLVRKFNLPVDGWGGYR